MGLRAEYRSQKYLPVWRTLGIPEIRALKNIAITFVCMSLSYTICGRSCRCCAGL